MSAAGPQIFPLTGTVTVRDVTRLAEALQGALTASSGLVIDCTGLTEIDLAVVQLLIAARTTASATGKSLTLKTIADGPLSVLLRQTGFIAADGRALTPEGDFWTQGKAA